MSVGTSSPDEVRGDHVGLVADVPAGVLGEQREHGGQRPGGADPVAEAVPTSAPTARTRSTCGAPRASSYMTPGVSGVPSSLVRTTVPDVAVHRDTADPRRIDPRRHLGERGVDGPGPVARVLLVADVPVRARGVVAAQRPGRRGVHRAVVADGQRAHALGAEVDPDPGPTVHRSPSVVRRPTTNRRTGNFTRALWKPAGRR